MGLKDQMKLNLQATQAWEQVAHAAKHPEHHELLGFDAVNRQTLQSLTTSPGTRVDAHGLGLPEGKFPDAVALWAKGLANREGVSWPVDVGG